MLDSLAIVRRAPCALLALALAVPVLAQETAPAQASKLPDDQELVAALIRDTAKSARKREQDTQTAAFLERLRTFFLESGPNDRRRIADAAVDCLNVKRKPLEGEDPEKTWLLPIAAAKVLGTMHPESDKDLAKAVEDKAILEQAHLFGAVADAVARAADEPARQLLLGLLDSKESVAQQARLVKALRHFKTMPEKERKETFERVMQSFVEVNDRMDNNDDLIEGLQIAILYEQSANRTLSDLSGGHEEKTPKDWERWWKANRKEPWPQTGTTPPADKDE
jgi:hypothetical protein